ncbi:MULTISPECIES: triphosphoribosyl-dephospho-CoA synthase [Halobacterium]|uniref:triphosphoribosyl-dephospho-CoA synthase n=1 Tax=Halobacterium TaxID=2239 RepID=UPI0009E9E035|nr:triphosphoribosyl-dephospho-CoA synthase [Halobacterium sp. CBA1132]MCG1003668.1 triphosphoribosyl-dephospho-CoA synthase [Halobacterium noricense]
MTPPEHAELALLVEVAGTPKPGNVDRERDLADLHFEQFLAGAVGARDGLEAAADGPVGDAFETAVAGMADGSGTNTQFGCLLLLTPLVRAASRGDLSPEGVTDIVEATTVADAEAFYRAFEHAEVAVPDPPEGVDALDARRGAAAIPALRERDLTLEDVMALGTDHDANAREWLQGFPRVFRAAARIEAERGPLTDRAASAFLTLLAEDLDTLVVTQHGEGVAREVQERALSLQRADTEEVREFADDLVERGVNPGTTADLTAAAVFVALERGVSVRG